MKELDPDFEKSLNSLMLQRAQIIHARNAGSAVTRVVRRCDDASEDGCLNLSECQLMQVPDAVYHLLRDTELFSCNLAGNSISRLPPKFSLNFTALIELNLSHNKFTELPDEISYCQSLTKLDISHNEFREIPFIVFRLTQLTHLHANHNFIIDVGVDQVPKGSSIEEVDLRGNPLLPACHETLCRATNINIKLTEREPEDWEDLDI